MTTTKQEDDQEALRKVAERAQVAGMSLVPQTNGGGSWWSLQDSEGYPKAVGSIECLAICPDLGVGARTL